MKEYQGVKMSWVELDRIVSEEMLRDDGIWRRAAESGRPLRSHATDMTTTTCSPSSVISGWPNTRLTHPQR